MGSHAPDSPGPAFLPSLFFPLTFTPLSHLFPLLLLPPAVFAAGAEMPMSCCWWQMLHSSLWIWVLLMARAPFPLLPVAGPGEASAQLKDTAPAPTPPDLPGLYPLQHPVGWAVSSSEVSQHSHSARGARDRTVASQTSLAGGSTARSGPHLTGSRLLEVIGDIPISRDRCRDHPYQSCLCSLLSLSTDLPPPCFP